MCSQELAMPFPEAKKTHPWARIKEGIIIRIQLTISNSLASGKS